MSVRTCLGWGLCSTRSLRAPFRILTLLAGLALMAACNTGPQDRTPTSLGEFKLGHNVVVAKAHNVAAWASRWVCDQRSKNLRIINQ